MACRPGRALPRSSLDSDSPKPCAQLRQRRLVFEDRAKVERTSVRELLGEVPRDLARLVLPVLLGVLVPLTSGHDARSDPCRRGDGEGKGPEKRGEEPRDVGANREALAGRAGEDRRAVAGAEAFREVVEEVGGAREPVEGLLRRPRELGRRRLGPLGRLLGSARGAFGSLPGALGRGEVSLDLVRLLRDGTRAGDDELNDRSLEGVAHLVSFSWAVVRLEARATFESASAPASRRASASESFQFSVSLRASLTSSVSAVLFSRLAMTCRARASMSAI